MKTSELINSVESFMNEGLEIMDNKNTDYSGKDDAFANFDSVEKAIGISSEQGIMVRMSDKLNRVGNIINNGQRVQDEAIKDTLIDLANYTYILLARIQHRKFINDIKYKANNNIRRLEDIK